jgi:hypothetical protein
LGFDGLKEDEVLVENAQLRGTHINGEEHPEFLGVVALAHVVAEVLNSIVEHWPF